MSTYTAVARRSGDWWAISVPALKGVHTQARRLEQVEAMAREAIALMLDTDPVDITVGVQAELPAAAEDALAARRRAREAEKLAEQTTTDAVAVMLSEGYTVRDVGAMLDLSPQRISQIASASHRRKAKNRKAPAA